MFLVHALYLLSLVTWIGSIIFFSFIGAPSIFKALPPEYAGKAVAAIFPKYYPMGSVSGFIILFCLIYSGFKTGSWSASKIILILLMLTFNIYTSLMIYPRARSLKEEIQMETSKTDMTVLQREFNHAHRVSVINNAIVLLLGLILIILTAKSLIL